MRLILAALAAMAALGAPAVAQETAGPASSPPIENGAGTSGLPFASQTFAAPPIEVDPLAGLSVAERHRIAIRSNGTIPAGEAVLTCEVADDGHVERESCEAGSWFDELQLLAMRLARAAPEAQFPRFPAIDRAALGLAPRGGFALWSRLLDHGLAAPRGGTPPFFRLVHLPVVVRQAEAPLVDLGTGPVVEKALVVFESEGNGQRIDYPARAIREDVQGVQTVECQVQADRSVICHEIAFEPPGSAGYFSQAPLQVFRHAVVADRLGDGNDAIGARFRFLLRWVLD